MVTETDASKVFEGVDPSKLPDYARAAYERDVAEAQSVQNQPVPDSETTGASDAPADATATATDTQGVQNEVQPDQEDESKDVEKPEQAEVTNEPAEKSGDREEARKRSSKGRETNHALRTENKRIKAERDELRAQLEKRVAAAPAAAPAAEKATVESLDLTPEEIAAFDPDTLKMIQKLSVAQAKKLLDPVLAKTAELDAKLEENRKAQAAMEQRTKQEAQFNFEVDIEDALGMSGDEVSAIRSDPGFQKFLSEPDIKTGRTRKDWIALAEQDLNPDVFVEAVRDYRATLPGTKEYKAKVQEKLASQASVTSVAPPHRPKPQTDEYTLDKWNSEFKDAQRLVRAGDPLGHSKMKKLNDALERGKVK